MKGYILDINEKEGIISADDEKRYKFALNEWKENTPPKKGEQVDFEIDGEYAKDIYLISVPSQKIISIGIQPDIKILGGLGSIFLLFSWIPYLGLILYIAGLIMISVAIKRISNQALEKGIFTKWIISILLGIGIVLLMGVAFGLFMVLLGNDNSDTAIGMTLILGGISYIVLQIIIGILYKQIFHAIAEVTGENLFKTAGTTFFWGGILSIIIIGAFLFFIGWILVAIAFFSMNTKED